jgi:inner membrane protein
MAALLSHAVAGAGIAAALRPSPSPPARYWALAIFCAVIPDFDIPLVWMGTNYRGMFGHRGITHSIAFAAALAALLAYEAFPAVPWRDLRFRLGFALFAAGVSHGVLDALMDVGKGVAFFAPFSARRFHFPVRPIHGSPPSDAFLLREGGVKISASELAWIWAPSVLLFALSFWFSKRRARSRAGLVPKDADTAG